MAILLSEAPLRLFKLLLGLGWVEAGERRERLLFTNCREEVFSETKRV
jgi:hypothetical protein